MRIHKEGYFILITLLGLVFITNLVVFTIFSSRQGFAFSYLLFSVIAYFLIIWFFRLPHRYFKQDENIIISPADGKIVVIEETQENEFFNEKRLQVSIFMSPLNVHVNFFPISGMVSYFKYHPGNYLVAWHPKASEKNERCSVVIDNGEHRLLVRQIAGALARRIVCYARPEEQIQQGQELGFIKFGSRVDLFLPTDVKLNIKLGQKVSGKKSVIAFFD